MISGTAGKLTFAKLKTKQRAVRGGFSEALTLRVHRAISWLGRAEAETDDLDVSFILLWVGFNSAYANEISLEAVSERGNFKAYFDTLLSLDKTDRVYNAVWEKFPQEIRLLLTNKYVFAPYWRNQNGVSGYEDWQERLSSSHKTIQGALRRYDTSRILSIVFDRLYVLRNQLVHGGATWNSAVNRKQVRDGAAVLGWLLPVFIDIMMDNPEHSWGRPFYPVIKEEG